MFALESKTLADWVHPTGFQWWNGPFKINESGTLFVQLRKLSPREGSDLLRDMALHPILLGFCGVFEFTIFLHPLVALVNLVERFIRGRIGHFTDEKSVLQQGENSSSLSFSPALYTMGTWRNLNHRLK